MAERARIKTPWKHQWRRVRYQVVPVLTMGACILLTGWLWQRQSANSQALGEVQLVQINITAPASGRLVMVGEVELEMFQRVSRDQLIARLDDREILATIERTRAELQRLQGGDQPDLIASHQARLRELQAQHANLEFRSPIDGYISAIHRLPGQAVVPGDILLQIVEDEPRYIISYLRQEQRIDVIDGASVRIRDRHQRGGGIPSIVANVGKHNEPIPPHQLRNPNVPEWGRPVLIQRPLQSRFRPGELVDVFFEGQ